MIGHVLRQNRNSHTNIALSWTPEGEEQLRERGTAQDGVHGMRQELLQPTEKIGGILWRPYVPRGTKKLSEVK